MRCTNSTRTSYGTPTGPGVRRRVGLEAAQVALGHERADVTQVYAERNTAFAAEIG